MITWARPWSRRTGLSVVLAGAACSPDPGASLEGVVEEAAPDGCLDNETMPCACGSSAGSATCFDGVWSACACSAPPAVQPGPGAGGSPTGVAPTFEGNLRTDISFDWQSTAAPVDDGTCPPGLYEGNLQGWYWSILAAGLGVPIANIELPGSPSGFRFDLSPAKAGETVQKVEGELNGIADLVFPFKARIVGELNCRSATFTGRVLDGSYSILVDGFLPQKFEGVASSRYDKRTRTFVNGVWDVAEISAVPPGRLAQTLPRDYQRDGFGGSGEFAAGFATDLSDPGVTACPASFTCGPGFLGPNKLLCNTLLGPPGCVTDADCATPFPGGNVVCLKAGPSAMCVRECRP